MGEERDSPSKMRMFLTRLAMAFHKLVTSALNGTYDDVDTSFSVPHDERGVRRLRATIENLDAQLADTMRDRGAKRRMVADSDGPHSADDVPHTDDESSGSNGGQVRVSRKEMRVWIRQVRLVQREPVDEDAYCLTGVPS